LLYYISIVKMYDKGRSVGSKCWRTYKWQITIHDLETGTSQVGKYITLEDFYNKQHIYLTTHTVKKLKNIREKLGDYSMDDVRNANPFSVLAKYGHLKIEKIHEPVNYTWRIVE